jgi:hypothetical protein
LPAGEIPVPNERAGVRVPFDASVQHPVGRQPLRAISTPQCM